VLTPAVNHFLMKEDCYLGVLFYGLDKTPSCSQNTV
jgi:hypothetical protein